MRCSIIASKHENYSPLLIWCITDSKTNIQPKDNVEYAWEFSRLDGTSVDTGAILDPESGSIELKDNEITMTGIRQTSSVRGRCRVQRLDDDETTVDKFYSPYFRFDVTDGTDANTRDFVAPTDPGKLKASTGILPNGIA